MIKKALFVVAELRPEQSGAVLQLLKHLDYGDAQAFEPHARRLIADTLEDIDFRQEPISAEARRTLEAAIDSYIPHKLVTVAEYAAMHGRSPDTIRQRIRRGATRAQQIGSVWMIYADEPLEDNRKH